MAENVPHLRWRGLYQVTDCDSEITALAAAHRALQPLDRPARERALRYLCQALLLRDSDRSGGAGETAKTGSTEGESAGRNGIAQPLP